MNIAILGASNNESRYSYKVLKALEKTEHQIFLISPKYSEIEGHQVFHQLGQLNQIEGDIDILTLYVNEKISTDQCAEIIDLKPKLVIFNPGSENEALKKELDKNAIKTLEACTLVLISTGQLNSKLFNETME